MERFDCIVIGLGAMGGAALYQSAKRGARVLGFEQFDIGHDRGSAHGETRIIRKAYFEHPDYVPLLHRAYELWGELERAVNQRLVHRCGLLMLGRPDGEVLTGVRRAAALHGLGIDRLRRAQTTERFSGFSLGDDHEALYEADAGYVLVDDAVRAQVAAARNAGAVVRSGETVREWSADGAGVIVRTDRGDYAADRLIIAAGAWSARLLADLRLPLTVLRKVQLWFWCEDSRYAESRGMPAFCFDHADGFFYGFPCRDGATIKIAEHSGREGVADPAIIDRSLRHEDVEPVARFVSRHMPGVRTDVARYSTCLYTMTPDQQFVIDRHPQHSQVAFAAGFSGHGFKFAPIVGSVLADLALSGSTSEPIGFLSASRKAIQSASA